MNLREETIKVLRQCALELTEAGNIIAKNNDGALPSTGSLFLHSAERVNGFLSRLEAGSGEETGWQPIETAPKDGKTWIEVRMPRADGEPGWWVATAVLNDEEEYSRHSGVDIKHYNGTTLVPGFHFSIGTIWRPLSPPLSQEGGDAVAPGRRPHVATPAPGENSERATPTTEQTAFSQLKEWLAFEYERGRRSMREEAAKVAEGEEKYTYGIGAQRVCRKIAAAIRVIPEKQS